MSYIVNFYIEIGSEADQPQLERMLNNTGYPFYDATHVAVLPPTLEEVETILERK